MGWAGGAEGPRAPTAPCIIPERVMNAVSSEQMFISEYRSEGAKWTFVHVI